MQVILLEKVSNLGDLGSLVNVKPGYARNFLIPTGRARRATPTSIADFEAKRAELKRQAAEKLSQAEGIKSKLQGLTIRLTQKAGVDGRLFGSVTNADVAAGLKVIGYDFQKSQVRMPQGPLKTLGEHEVQVAAHTDVIIDVKVLVLAEQG